MRFQDINRTTTIELDLVKALDLDPETTTEASVEIVGDVATLRWTGVRKLTAEQRDALFAKATETIGGGEPAQIPDLPSPPFEEA